MDIKPYLKPFCDTFKLRILPHIYENVDNTKGLYIVCFESIPKENTPMKRDFPLYHRYFVKFIGDKLYIQEIDYILVPDFIKENEYIEINDYTERLKDYYIKYYFCEYKDNKWID